MLRLRKKNQQIMYIYVANYYKRKSRNVFPRERIFISISIVDG